MSLLNFLLFFVELSIAFCGFNLTQTDNELYKELIEQSFEFDQAIYPWLFTIAPSAQTKFNVHQLKRLKSAMNAITQSIDCGILSIDQIQKMFFVQSTPKVMSRIGAMMSTNIDVSDLLIDGKLAIIPHHMIVRHLSTQIVAFDRFIEFWEETGDFVRDILLTSFEEGGHAKLGQIQNLFLLAAKCKFPYAMIRDLLFEIASHQNNEEAIKGLADRIHSCSNVKTLFAKLYKHQTFVFSATALTES